MVNLESVGLALMKARQAKGLSQEDLAAEAGIARNYLSRIENGKVNPSITVFISLIQALGIKANDILN